MISIALPLSACVTIAFFVVNFLFSSFITRRCLFWSILVCLVELMICFSFFAAMKRCFVNLRLEVLLPVPFLALSCNLSS